MPVIMGYCEKCKQADFECICIEVCPICGFPAKICEFFRKAGKLKFDEDPEMSAVKKSMMFLRYHADLCEKCKRGLAECREDRRKRVAWQMNPRNKKRDLPTAMDDSEIQSLVRNLKCSSRWPGHHKFHKVIPSWWRTQEQIYARATETGSVRDAAKEKKPRKKKANRGDVQNSRPESAVIIPQEM